MKNNINYRLRKLSHGLSSVGIVAVMLGTAVPFSTANVSDNLNLEHVAQAAETANKEDDETIIEENRDNDDTLMFEEDDETIIKQNEGEQSPSERDNNNATEKVHDSSNITKEQKQGQPELAETGIQKNNRLALLGIAGIGIVIAGLFFFISRRDKK